MHRYFVFVVGVVAAVVAACTDPDTAGQSFACDDVTSCATGYQCVAGLCRPDGWRVDLDADSGAVGDGAPEDGSGAETGPDAVAPPTPRPVVWPTIVGGSSTASGWRLRSVGRAGGYQGAATSSSGWTLRPAR